MSTTVPKRAASPEDKAQKKELILATALSLLGTKSYNQITMNEIALSAKVAKGTLFNYFTTKEELFLWVFLDLHEDYFHHLEAELRLLRPNSIDALHFFSSQVSRLDFNSPYLRLLAILHSQLELHLSKDVTSHYKKCLAELNHSAATLSSERFSELGLEKASAFYDTLPILIIGCLHVCTSENFITQLQQLIEFHLYAALRHSSPNSKTKSNLVHWLL